MAFGNFFRKLLGGVQTLEMSDDPFGSRQREATAAKPAGNAPAAASASAPRCLVQRDEMLDARSRIAGYRFTVRRVDSALSPTFDETVAALRAENISAFAQRRLALLQVSVADSHRAGIRQFIAPNTFFLISSPPAGEDWGAWQQAVEALKLAGGKLAVDDTAAAEKTALACADLCVLDFRGYALENFERLLRRLTRGETPQTVAVNGLSAWAEHRLCMDRRATYTLGGFASQPDEAESGERLNQSRLVLIEMLNLLRRDADIAEIAAVAKRDPVVAVKVLAMANTPILGLSAPVANIDQAMLVLGRATLYRWLSVSMFRAGSEGGRDESLLEMALWRARFLELAAAGLHTKEACDELFLVGLFSLLDSLLGMPMARVVERMTLPPAVREVLVDSSGPYVRHLMLALAVEKGRFDHASRVADMLGINEANVETSARDARAWAEAALDAGRGDGT